MGQVAGAPLKSLAAGLVMLVGAALSVALRPTHLMAHQGPQIDLKKVVPTHFDGWRVDHRIVPIAPSSEVEANLKRTYGQILSRTYVNRKGDHMMLTIAFGPEQTDQLQAHRQEVCYASQGFHIKDLIHSLIHVDGSAIPSTRFFAVRGPRQEPVTYWFTMGNHVVLSHFQRLMTQVRYGLTGVIPDGMLVRVSDLSGDPRKAYQAQTRFMDELFRHMPPGVVERLTGAPPRSSGKTVAATQHAVP
ncbi:MAG: exosortase-associated protein EpsI, B-type [Sulfobacillus sp.]